MNLTKIRLTDSDFSPGTKKLNEQMNLNNILIKKKSSSFRDVLQIRKNCKNDENNDRIKNIPLIRIHSHPIYMSNQEFKGIKSKYEIKLDHTNITENSVHSIVNEENFKHNFNNEKIGSDAVPASPVITAKHSASSGFKHNFKNEKTGLDAVPALPVISAEHSSSSKFKHNFKNEEIDPDAVPASPVITTENSSSSNCGDQETKHLFGTHIWYPTSHTRPTYCNVCREQLCGVTSQGLSCEICKFKCHKRCTSKAFQNCKWTTLASIGKNVIQENDGTISFPHQWLEGNLPLSAKCTVCERACGSVLRLQDLRCLWCRACVHISCKPIMYQKCPGGRISVVPPTALHETKIDNVWNTPNSIPGCSPLLVFVNSKSGNHQGLKILRRFKQLLNPAQVFDLMKGGPKRGLECFQNFEPFRILVCGGDGSVGWVMSEIDKLKMHKQLCVGVLPLGTGNDLARVLGWGASYDGSNLKYILDKYETATTKMLDRWSVLTFERDDPVEPHILPPPDPPTLLLSKSEAAEIGENCCKDIIEENESKFEEDGRKNGKCRTIENSKIHFPKIEVESPSSSSPTKSPSDSEWIDADFSSSNTDEGYSCEKASISPALTKLCGNKLLTVPASPNLPGRYSTSTSGGASSISSSTTSPQNFSRGSAQRSSRRISTGAVCGSLEIEIPKSPSPKCSYSIDLDTNGSIHDSASVSPKNTACKERLHKVLPIVNPLLSNESSPTISCSKGIVSKVLLANADTICAVASPLMDSVNENNDLMLRFNEKCVLNNYFGIGIDAKITHDFHLKREEHPEKCQSRTKNFMWYGVLGTKEYLQQTCKNLEQRVQLECDGKVILLTNLQGIVILNIQSFMGGTNFWGGTKENDYFLAPSFDDKILEVVAVYSSMQMAASRLIKLQHHRVAQCQSVRITILGDDPIPVQVDGEAWLQPPGVIKILHKNRMQMLCRNRNLESCLRTWEKKQHKGITGISPTSTENEYLDKKHHKNFFSLGKLKDCHQEKEKVANRGHNDAKTVKASHEFSHKLNSIR